MARRRRRAALAASKARREGDREKSTAEISTLGQGSPPPPSGRQKSAPACARAPVRPFSAVAPRGRTYSRFRPTAFDRAYHHHVRTFYRVRDALDHHRGGAKSAFSTRCLFVSLFADPRRFSLQGQPRILFASELTYTADTHGPLLSSHRLRARWCGLVPDAEGPWPARGGGPSPPRAAPPR